MNSNYFSQIWKPSHNVFFGKSKKLTNFKTNKYLLGNQENLELFNLAKSRQLIILQLMPFIKTVFRDQDIYTSPQFLFASEAGSLQEVLQVSAEYCGMTKAPFPWVNGYLTARIRRETRPEYCVIPNLSESSSILKEATRNFMVTIGLVTNNQKNLEAISHPIFSNCSNLKICSFFSLLISNLIARYSTEKNCLFSKKTVRNQIRYSSELLIQSKLKTYSVFGAEEFEPNFAQRSEKTKVNLKKKILKRYRQFPGFTNLKKLLKIKRGVLPKKLKVPLVSQLRNSKLDEKTIKWKKN